MPVKKVSKKVAGKVSKSVAKRVKIQAEAEPTVEVPVVVTPPVEPVNVQVPKYDHIIFEGAKVVAILPTKHTLTHFHCKMSSGDTKHVPKSLFE